MRQVGHGWQWGAELDDSGDSGRLGRLIEELFGHSPSSRLLDVPCRGPRWLLEGQGRAGGDLAVRAGLVHRGRPVHGVAPRVVAAGAASEGHAAALLRGVLVARGVFAVAAPALRLPCPSLAAGMVAVRAARHLGVAARCRDTPEGWEVSVSSTAAVRTLLAACGGATAAATWDRQLEARRSGGAGLDGVASSTAVVSATVAGSAAARPAAAVADAVARLEAAGVEVPAPLGYAARLRLSDPTMSLAQLAAIADPPMTKDVLAGRIRRLLRIAEPLPPAATGPPTQDQDRPGGEQWRA